MPLTILAQITATLGKKTLVRDALMKLVAPTRAEEGCIMAIAHECPAFGGLYVGNRWCG